MTDGAAEVITTAIVAALFYRANFESARTYLKEQGFIAQMLGKSRLNRRLHRVRNLFLTLFAVLGETWKALNAESIYSIDSFPIPVCDNYRIRRCKLHHDEAYRGYQASRKRFFYGVKIHVLVTATGEPVEVMLTSGSCSNVACLDDFDWGLPRTLRCMLIAATTMRNLKAKPTTTPGSNFKRCAARI